MEQSQFKRIPAKKMAKQLGKILRRERPDYNYMKDIFRHLRNELNVTVTKIPRKLPYVPTEEVIRKYYKAVWASQNMNHVLIIKILLYTGIRVTELIRTKISDISLEECTIKINNGKGGKDRVVPFPKNFKETLGMHIREEIIKGAEYLFESSWRKGYSDRGIRKILEKYTKEAGIERSISPHKLRHYLFTWMKKQGVDDAFIQPYSGHDSRQSLELYSKLSIKEAQDEYDRVIGNFTV